MIQKDSPVSGVSQGRYMDAMASSYILGKVQMHRTHSEHGVYVVCALISPNEDRRGGVDPEYARKDGYSHFKLKSY